MLKYILRRVVSALLTIWFVITITFLIMHNLPGSPFTGSRSLPDETRVALEAKYGLDKPITEQYLTYLGNFIKGDFGVSYLKRGVTTKAIIDSGFPYSRKDWALVCGDNNGFWSLFRRICRIAPESILGQSLHAFGNFGHDNTQFCSCHSLPICI